MACVIVIWQIILPCTAAMKLKQGDHKDYEWWEMITELMSNEFMNMYLVDVVVGLKYIAIIALLS